MSSFGFGAQQPQRPFEGIGNSLSLLGKRANPFGDQNEHAPKLPRLDNYIRVKRDQYEKLEKDANHFKEEFNAIRLQLKSSRAVASERFTQKENLQKELDSLKRERDQERSQYFEKITETIHKTIEESLVSRSKRLEELETQVKDANQKITHLTGELSHTIFQRDRKVEESNNLHTVSLNLKAQRDDLKKRTISMEEEIGTLKSERDTLTKKVEELEVEKEENKKRMDTFRSILNDKLNS